MAHVPIEIPPGMNQNGTDFEQTGRWNDGDLVRWHNGVLQPVGGWTVFATFLGGDAPRGMAAWQANNGDRWIAAGSYRYLNVFTSGGTRHDITPSGLTSGQANATINTGYGAELYGRGLYGTPRNDNTTFTEATTWDLDVWGQNLVACSSADGKLYEWTLNTANPAAQITNSPTSCKGLVVTEDRFLVALQAGGNPRKVQWSDREDNTVWTPSATNEAGDFDLQTPGEIMQAVRVRGQILLLTNVDAHSMTPTGSLSSVFSFQRVDDAGGSVSRKAAAALGSAVYWMGPQAFYKYEGGVAQALPCEVGDFVFRDINPDYHSIIWAVSNRQYGEIWWFYQSKEANAFRYVAYNARDNHWMTGQMGRSAGVDQGAFRYPIWSGSSGTLRLQEYGWTHDVGRTSYVESGPLKLGSGDRIARVREFIPDELQRGDSTVTFKVRYFPNGEEYEYGPYDMKNPLGVKFSGRQFRVRIDGDNATNWRSGVHRVDVVEGGRR